MKIKNIGEQALFREGYGGTFTPVRFTGTDYKHKKDRHRLYGKMQQVFNIIKDGKWRTYRQLFDVTHPLSINDDTAGRMVRKINESMYLGYHIEFGKNESGFKTFRCVKL